MKNLKAIERDRKLKEEFLANRQATVLQPMDCRPKDFKKIIADTVCLLREEPLTFSGHKCRHKNTNLQKRSSEMNSWSEAQAAKKENKINEGERNE